MSECVVFEKDMMDNPVIVCDIIVYCVQVNCCAELRIGMVTEVKSSGLKVIVVDDDERWNKHTREYESGRRFRVASVHSRKKIFKIETFSNQYNELREIFNGYEEWKKQDKIKRAKEKAEAEAKTKAKDEARRRGQVAPNEMIVNINGVIAFVPFF